MLDVEITNETIEAAGRAFASRIDREIMLALYENNQWFSPKETKSMYGLMADIIQYIWKIDHDDIYGKEMRYMTKSAMNVRKVTFERDACRTTDHDGAIDLHLCGYFDGEPFEYLGTIATTRLMLNAIPNEIDVATVRASNGSISINVPAGATAGQVGKAIAKQLNGLKRGPQTVQNPGSGQGCACGDPFCTGCATGHARGQGGVVGQPNYAMGGVIPSNMVPLTPTQSYTIQGGQITGIGALKAINDGRALSAYEVLKEIEPYITAKQGMLSGSSFLIFRITLPDRNNWQEGIKERMDELNAKLGGKIGLLGDQQIVGLDEPYDPDGGPTAVRTSSATGKVAVHLARRDSYAAWKVTILALVKA